MAAEKSNYVFVFTKEKAIELRELVEKYPLKKVNALKEG